MCLLLSMNNKHYYPSDSQLSRQSDSQIGNADDWTFAADYMSADLEV